MVRGRVAHRWAVLPMLAIVAASALGSVASAQSPSASPGTIEGAGSPPPSGSPGPGIAEVALCETPELGEPAGGATSSRLASRTGAGPASDAVVATVQDDTVDPHQCRLPGSPDFVPLYGVIDEAQAFEVGDPLGDGPIDVTEVYTGSVTLDQAAASAARNDPGLVLVGRPGKVVKAGVYRVLDVATAGPFGPVDGLNPSIQVFTDKDGKTDNDVPASVDSFGSPLIGAQQVSTIVFPATTDTMAAYSTDFATGTWYEGKQGFFAFPRADGMGAQIYLPAAVAGGGFLVASYQDGPSAGYDIVSLASGNRWLPFSGLGFGAPWFTCFYNAVFHEEVSVRALKIQGQAQTGLKLPSQKVLGACFQPTAADTEILLDYLDDFGGFEWEGAVGVTMTSRGEQGGKLRVVENVDLEVQWFPDGRFYFRIVIGLFQYGRHDITGLRMLPGDDPAFGGLVQDFLDAALDAEAPFQVEGGQEGPVNGLDGCLPPVPTA
jgi:hypothetical protein